MRLAIVTFLLCSLASPALAIEYDGPFCVHLPRIDEFGDWVDAYKEPLPVQAVPDPTPSWNRELGWVDVPQPDLAFVPTDPIAPYFLRRIFSGSSSAGIPMP